VATTAKHFDKETAPQKIIKLHKKLKYVYVMYLFCSADIFRGGWLRNQRIFESDWHKKQPLIKILFIGLVF